MQGGIAISFIKMKGIQISAAGDYAELQPGLTNGDLIRYLWANGKQTGMYNVVDILSRRTITLTAAQ